jgi:hypothetical protein
VYEGRNAYKILTGKYYELEANDRMLTGLYVEYINESPYDISAFLGLLVILMAFRIH